MKIRTAGIEDLPALHQLYTETIRHTCKNDYNADQIDVWVSSIENTSRWINAITTQYFLVAEIDHQLAGFASLKDGNYLDFMYVNKDFLRRGVANKLFQELLREATRLKTNGLSSDVSKTARPFFEKKGFKVVKKNTNLIKGIEIVNFRMVLEFGNEV